MVLDNRSGTTALMAVTCLCTLSGSTNNWRDGRA
jgi:hypothetical protein